MQNIPEMMTAVLLTGHGGFERLEYRMGVPVTTLSKDEVLVKVGGFNIRINFHASLR